MIVFLLVLSVSVKVYTAPNCGQTYYDGTSGLISSPKLANATCVFKIDVSAKSRWILLEWTTFQFDANMPYCYDGDYVEVFTGCLSRKTSVSRFCSRNMKQLPHAIFAFDGCMEIQMKARRSSFSNFFKASYQTYTTDQSAPPRFYSKCYSVQNIYSTVGVISSSGWPLSYRDSSKLVLPDCQWNIDALNSKKFYKLNFMDMDLYKSGIFSDDIIVKGKASTKDDWKYSRKNQQPFSLITQYSSLKVKFDTSLSSSGNYRGFIVGFVAYDAQVSISVSWKIIVGVVLPILFLCAFLGAILRVYKKRRNANQSSYNNTSYGTIPSETSDSKIQPGYPLQQNNPQQPGYPPQQPGYPPQQPGYPPQYSVYPPQQPVYPPLEPVYPPQQPEYPQQSAYPPPVQQS